MLYILLIAIVIAVMVLHLIKWVDTHGEKDEPKELLIAVIFAVIITGSCFGVHAIDSIIAVDTETTRTAVVK